MVRTIIDPDTEMVRKGLGRIDRARKCCCIRRCAGTHHLQLMVVVVVFDVELRVRRRRHTVGKHQHRVPCHHPNLVPVRGGKRTAIQDAKLCIPARNRNAIAYVVRWVAEYDETTRIDLEPGTGR